MNPRTLRALLKIKGLTPAALAKGIGVSRQAISQWLKQTNQIGLNSKSLAAIAQKFGLTLDEIYKPLPIVSDPREKKLYETELLWDFLYPDLESFVSALVRGQSEALARLVQVYGLFKAEKIAGRQIWNKFQKYKIKIAPAWRRQAEVIWNTQKSLGLI